jgi:hypothetical protein
VLNYFTIAAINFCEMRLECIARRI